MHSITIHGARKFYGSHRALDDLSLSIEPREFVVLLGPSGCGKSTLLNAVAGLDALDGGRIEIAGRDVTHLEPKERGVAMVFQSYALYPAMTVAQNLSFGLRMAGGKAVDIRTRVTAIAQILKIGDLLKRRPAELSGGQRQRVAIGRALIRDVGIYLFDEPLSNLDAKLRAEMRIELKRLHERLGATIIYVTHDQIEAMTLATRIAVIRGGRIEQYATPQLLYDRPATAFVAGFVGAPAMNLLRGRLRRAGGRVWAELSAGPLPLDDYPFASDVADQREIIVGIRPEDIRLHTLDSSPAFDLPVLTHEPMGATSLVWCAFGQERLAAALSPQADPWRGRRLPLTLSTAKLSVFCATAETRL